MITAVIVQARMASTRLPGKILRTLGDRPVLAHVLERCRAIPGCDKVVCAVPDEDASEPLAQIAQDSGAMVYRGPEHDVLRRYLGAAWMADVDMIMRVTSDCPLIDPSICAAVIDLCQREKVDYAANNMPRSFPHGLDCEAFPTRVLAEAERSTSVPDDREHVTPWMRRARHLSRANLHSGRAGLERHRWTLDYPEDLEFFEALFRVLPRDVISTMDDVLEALRANPSISDLNSSRYSAPISGPNAT